MKKIKTFTTTLSGILPLLMCTAIGVIFIAFTGCEDMTPITKPVVDAVAEPADTTEPTTTVGEEKKPEPAEPTTEQPTEPAEPVQPAEEPSEPTPPTDTTPPTVTEVGWYSDRRMTEVITDDVQPGDTIYTVVVFSEAVQHSVADGKDARPALSIVIDGTATRYQMLAHRTSDNDLTSGSATPLGGGTDNFICKYTIPADTVGTIALRVGGATADLAGNTVAEVSEHIASFVVAEPVQPAEELGEQPEPEPTEEEHAAARQRAESIVKRIIDLQNGLVNRDEESEMRIFEYESGLEYQFIYETLFQEIYLEEKPQDAEEPFSWYDTVLEYLQLKFLYPDASEKELLDHFRQSVRDGQVQIDIMESEFVQKIRSDREKIRQTIPSLHPVSKKIFDREIEALQQKERDPSFDIDTERDKIFKEEANLSFDFVHNTLLEIHLEENPDDRQVVDSGIYEHSGLIFAYLLQRKSFPEESEKDILMRFREFSRNKGISIGLDSPLFA